MPWSPHPSPLHGTGLQLVTELLDPILAPLGFAPGQVGVDGDHGQVTFCRGQTDSADGACVDLVLDVEASADWRIVDVRYWGFSTDRWHLEFDGGASLRDQVAGLARSLPRALEHGADARPTERPKHHGRDAH